MEVSGIAPDHPQSVAASGGLRLSPLIIFAASTNTWAPAQLDCGHCFNINLAQRCADGSGAGKSFTCVQHSSFSEDSMILHRLKSRATATGCYYFAWNMLQANNRSRSALLQTYLASCRFASLLHDCEPLAVYVWPATHDIGCLQRVMGILDSLTWPSLSQEQLRGFHPKRTPTLPY